MARNYVMLPFMFKLNYWQTNLKYDLSLPSVGVRMQRDTCGTDTTPSTSPRTTIPGASSTRSASVRPTRNTWSPCATTRSSRFGGQGQRCGSTTSRRRHLWRRVRARRAARGTWNHRDNVCEMAVCGEWEPGEQPRGRGTIVIMCVKWQFLESESQESSAGDVEPS